MKSVTPNDASSIKTMTILEHIRAKYEMYIGAGTLDSNYALMKELTDNSFDICMDESVRKVIKIVFFTDGTRYQACVIDHGCGIPPTKLKQVYTEAFTSGKYEDAYGRVSIGSYGIGSKALVGLSVHFLAITKRGDGFAGLHVMDGKVQDYQVFDTIDNNESTVGTTVIFEPDSKILTYSGKYMTDPEGLGRTLENLDNISVLKKGAHVIVHRVNKLLPDSWFKKSYADQWKYLQNVSGEIIYESNDFVDPYEYSRAKFGIIDPPAWTFEGHYKYNNDDLEGPIGYDFKVGLTHNPEKHQGIFGSVNYVILNDLKSSHIAVMQDQLKARLLPYLDEDDNELRAFIKSSYVIPLHGYIVGFAANASFVNQTKNSYQNNTWGKMYAAHLTRLLDKQPDAFFENLFDLIQKDMMEKFAKSINKSLNAGKSLKNVAFDLRRSDSYFACETKNKDQATLSIVEGLSSGNWITQLRDPSYQAVYELRGKCLNTFTSSKDQWTRDDVFSDLVRLIGVHPRDTNLDNMNFKEICIMADADPDGLSIIDLLIGMFYNINPMILDQGRVTIAMPPLYVLASKNKTMFLRDQHALDDAKVAIYERHLKIGVSVNGRKIDYLSGDAYRDCVYLIKRICTIIQEISRKLAIDPFIVEQMCHCVDYVYPGHVNTEAIKMILGLSDCFYSDNSNVITLIQDRAEVSVPVDRLMNEIRIYILPELEAIHWKSLTFFVTTKDTNYYKDAPVTFWLLQQIFDTFDKEFSIRRIKGLGECTASELKYTCLDPTTRTVVTIRGIGDVKTLYDMLGVDTSARKKLVESDFNSEWTRGVL